MTPRNKKESALGKGLDALIRKDYLDEDEKSDKSDEKTGIIEKTSKSSSTPSEEGAESETSSEVAVTTAVGSSKNFSADEKIVEAVLVEVHKNPRISLWSAKSAAVLRFLKKTKPEFSISNEASLLIEEAVKDRHPEIWKLFEEKGL